MNSFKSGKFQRDSLGRSLRHLCPAEAIHGIEEIDLDDWYQRGKRLILLDVDNTVVPWKSEEIPETTLLWLARGRALGFQFCLISNTRHRARLSALAERMELRYMVGKFKPSREMFVAALHEFQVTPEQAVMVGDQLFTDVLGANRAGIEAVWVKPSARREFMGTRVNRMLERAVRGRLYHVLEQEDDDLPIVRHEGIFQSRLVRQIAKFMIVGGSSFVIDAGLHKYLMFGAPWRGDLLSQATGTWLVHLANGGAVVTAEAAHDVAFTFFKFFSSSLAILNSFVWNRQWTFGIRGRTERGEQLAKFIAVSVTGLVLNILISSAMNRMVSGSNERSWLVATIVATGIVAVWNFCGQRFYAFRRQGT